MEWFWFCPKPPPCHFQIVMSSCHISFIIIGFPLYNQEFYLKVLAELYALTGPSIKYACMHAHSSTSQQSKVHEFSCGEDRTGTDGTTIWPSNSTFRVQPFHQSSIVTTPGEDPADLLPRRHPHHRVGRQGVCKPRARGSKVVPRTRLRAQSQEDNGRLTKRRDGVPCVPGVVDRYDSPIPGRNNKEDSQGIRATLELRCTDHRWFVKSSDRLHELCGAGYPICKDELSGIAERFPFEDDESLAIATEDIPVERGESGASMVVLPITTLERSVDHGAKDIGLDGHHRCISNRLGWTSLGRVAPRCTSYSCPTTRPRS